MSTGKPYRILKVRKHQKGMDIKLLQIALGVPPDGEYGPITATAAKAKARDRGVSRSTLLRGLTIGSQDLILGITKPNAAQRKRAAKRRSKAPLRLRAFAKAKLDVGQTERGANNRGWFVDKVIRANGGELGEPWCGDAVAYWYRLAGSKVVQRAWASTIWLLARLAPVRNPLRGHVVVYGFGSPGAKHTGLFDEWIGGGYFWAIEGNTGMDNAASDSSGGGDGVHRRKRHVSQVAGFRRVSA